MKAKRQAFLSAIQTVEKGMQLLYRLFPIGLWRRVIVPGAVRRPVNPALNSHVNGMDIGAQVQVNLFGDWPGPDGPVPQNPSSVQASASILALGR